jgi:LytS/YehU family sensor histidine kinase
LIEHRIIIVNKTTYQVKYKHEILLEQAKEMQQEQVQLYATFVLMCVNNNLPPITFNDWVTNIRR